MAASKAQSIFEYLTTKNPEILSKVNGDKPKTNSKSPDWWCPRRVKEWEEFNFETLKSVFDKEAFRQCFLSRDLDYPAPALLSIELDEVGEDTTRHILTRWTMPMVNSALDSVKASLNPVLWVPASLAARDWVKEKPPLTAKSRKRSYPDGAGIPPAPPDNEKHSDVDSTTSDPSVAQKLPQSKLPSEVKPGRNWDSSDLPSYHDKEGNWIEGMSRYGVYTRPIRQIFSYCILINARYGFIITTKEVFIIRVRPIGFKESQVSSLSQVVVSSTTRISDETSIRRQMELNGVMEYKSIPWSAHRKAETIENYEELTISLSLWLLHILAGNNSGISWEYNSLSEERLRKADDSDQQTKLPIENCQVADQPREGPIPTAESKTQREEAEPPESQATTQVSQSVYPPALFSKDNSH
ncbi:hypothetical protein GQ53DRAFT_820832 [Thozetella sp. PMI_491]|nr:hypothetical protein GQ53DRAFT_820832 [Thozetella sp. PMI_491]